MEHADIKEKSCCFTGHRDIPSGMYCDIGRLIERYIEKLAERGYDRFICGGALGFDTLAAVSVINFRNMHGGIKLHLALPCPEQDIRWSKNDRILYRKILEAADETAVLSSSYTRGCMMVRNRYMVDNSSVCICYVEKSSGGSFYTMNYALKSGLRVINIAKKPSEKSGAQGVLPE